MELRKLFANIEGTFDGVNIPEAGTDGSIEAAVGFFFILAGIIAVIMIILGGYWYVLSGGDPQKTKKAKDTILYAVIGLVISISAWIIVGFVLAST